MDKQKNSIQESYEVKKELVNGYEWLELFTLPVKIK